MDAYQPDYSYLNTIQIEKIIIDNERTLVTLFGQVQNGPNEDVEDWDFVCEYDVLSDLLLTVGESADPVLRVLSDLLSAGGAIESPTVIDAALLAGGPLLIAGALLKVYRPRELNEEGEWAIDETENCYCIESVNPLPLKEAKEDQKSRRTAFVEHLSLLREAYRFYEKLRRYEFPKKAARRQAGLSDKMLFRLAHLYAKMD